MGDISYYMVCSNIEEIAHSKVRNANALYHREITLICLK